MVCSVANEPSINMPKRESACPAPPCPPSTVVIVNIRGKIPRNNPRHVCRRMQVLIMPAAHHTHTHILFPHLTGRCLYPSLSPHNHPWLRVLLLAGSHDASRLSHRFNSFPYWTGTLPLSLAPKSPQTSLVMCANACRVFMMPTSDRTHYCTGLCVCPAALCSLPSVP